MRKTLLFVAAITAATLDAAPASAQILRGIGKRATDAVQRKTEDKVNQKIDAAAEKLVDRSFDSVFGAEGDGGGASASGGGSSRIFGMLPNAPTEDHYDFDVVLNYEMESMPKGKSNGEKTLMTMNFSSRAPYLGARLTAADAKRKGDGSVFAIFDAKNESMVMLMETDDGKMSMAYSWKDAKKYADQAAVNTNASAAAAARPATVPPDARFSKLGSKKIAGYTADGYRTETSEGIADVWVTQDPSLAFGTMMGATSSMKQMRSAIPGARPAGMLLETESTDKSSGDKVRMTITKVDKNASVRVNMSDYPRLGTQAK